jgi:hypothetical protein
VPLVRCSFPVIKIFILCILKVVGSHCFNDLFNTVPIQLDIPKFVQTPYKRLIGALQTFLQ